MVKAEDAQKTNHSSALLSECGQHP